MRIWTFRKKIFGAFSTDDREHPYKPSPVLHVSYPVPYRVGAYPPGTRYRVTAYPVAPDMVSLGRASACHKPSRRTRLPGTLQGSYLPGSASDSMP